MNNIFPPILAGKTSNSSATLSLHFLKLFKWKDESGAEQELRIINRISDKWRDVATLLGLGVCQMDGIQRESFMNAEQCCLRVFDDWIMKNGTTDYPLTWSGLHKLLKDIEHNAIAEDMKRALSAVGVDI